MIVADGRLESVLGTMGGLAQTQILTQLMLHLRAGDTAGQAVSRPRWILGGIGTDGDPSIVQAEARVPNAAVRALERGWSAIGLPDFSLEVGDSQVITVEIGEVLTAASDPRGVGASVVIDG